MLYIACTHEPFNLLCYTCIVLHACVRLSNHKTCAWSMHMYVFVVCLDSSSKDGLHVSHHSATVLVCVCALPNLDIVYCYFGSCASERLCCCNYLCFSQSLFCSHKLMLFLIQHFQFVGAIRQGAMYYGGNSI